ncbi:MAG TPA: hypothetical protein VK698_29760 [Kofleriaceae bacterium]|nr:hypothetical protein [Kofleriaceae bacterium]
MKRWLFVPPALLLLTAPSGRAAAQQPSAPPATGAQPAPAQPAPAPAPAPTSPTTPQETPAPTAQPTSPGEAPTSEPVPADSSSEPALPAAPAATPPPDEVVNRGPGGQSGFVDIRLNLTLTNENVFAEPGETIPSVPGWRFGRPNSLGTLFFDNYDTRFSGYETLSHAVLYKNYNRAEWEVEGALVLRINDLAERSIDLSDAGSYVRVARWTDPTRKKKELVSLTAFPTSSDRFRLGYSWRLSWGGSPEYQRSRAAVPGVKLQWENERVYAYVGAKSAVVLDRSTAEEEAVVAVLAGGGVDVTDMLRVEANGGYFDRGGNELQDVITEKVRLYGGSVQVALHKNEPVTSSVDYKLYRNDPERAYHIFATEEYPGGLSWLVAAEATALGQTLKDPEVSGGTKVQLGLAGDINTRVKYNRSRFRLDLQYRDLAFILHATPSLPTYSDFPPQYERTGNFFAAVGADQNFAGTGLTLGLIAGVDMPATLKTPTGSIPGDMVEGNGESTAVVRNEGDITVLPPGEDALPQLALKLTSRLDFAESFAALTDIYYTRDPNQTRLVRNDPEAPLRREFGEFNQLGFNFTLQAKF